MRNTVSPATFYVQDVHDKYWTDRDPPGDWSVHSLFIGKGFLEPLALHGSFFLVFGLAQNLIEKSSFFALPKIDKNQEQTDPGRHGLHFGLFFITLGNTFGIDFSLFY